MGQNRRINFEVRSQEVSTVMQRSAGHQHMWPTRCSDLQDDLPSVGSCYDYCCRVQWLRAAGAEPEMGRGALLSFGRLCGTRRVARASSEQRSARGGWHSGAGLVLFVKAGSCRLGLTGCTWILNSTAGRSALSGKATASSSHGGATQLYRCAVEDPSGTSSDAQVPAALPRACCVQAALTAARHRASGQVGGDS